MYNYSKEDSFCYFVAITFPWKPDAKLLLATYDKIFGEVIKLVDISHKVKPFSQPGYLVGS
jgi:hypothetical protein